MYRLRELSVINQSDRVRESEACWSVPGKERAGEACQAGAGIGRWMAYACNGRGRAKRAF